MEDNRFPIDEKKAVGFTFDESTRNDDATDMNASESVRTTSGSNKNEFDRKLAKTLSEAHIGGSGVSRRKRMTLMTDYNGCYVVWPWTRAYRTWWVFTVCCALLTVFTETYAIAFLPAGLLPFNDASSIIEFTLIAIFAIDIVINFNLAYFDDSDECITNPKQIAKHYFHGMFWWDMVGVFPFYLVALAIAGELGEDSQTAQYLAILRLTKLVRTHRAKQMFDTLQYNQKISLFSLTLCRNFCFCFVWSHFSACVFYFIARQQDFDANGTWIGGSIEEGLSKTERYLTSLYWSVVTFTTVGYGDYSPVSSAEQIWGMLYMLLNIIAQAWMIGSITLLIVKQDEKTGHYRDAMSALKKYANLNNFSKTLHRSLETQLKVEFNSREYSDETVLVDFPTAVRRKVLRRLYLPHLMQTSLMKGIRQQFVDAFLASCKVEIFTPGEEILTRGSVSSDLYLLVSGVVKLSHDIDPTVEETKSQVERSNYGGTSSIGDSQSIHGRSAYSKGIELGQGQFINEIGFFTESPQIDTVKTKTVCKTLTMTRVAYKSIAEDHPGSIGKVLHNLLQKVEGMAAEYGEQKLRLPTRLTVVRAGSIFDSSTNDEGDHTGLDGEELEKAVAAAQTGVALGSVQDIVRAHMNKQKDDNTTRFLFAASRGDTSTIALMCEQGFDPNTADYDSRTALMVAAMKGNTETVQKLIDYHVNPNLTDMHGSSALYEAARNGHEATMEVLLQNGATLCMDESQAAGKLCAFINDGDILSLRRLLKANIQVNAADYDKRTGAHIAAAEGNLTAMKLLVEYGADLSLADRWGNTIYQEAKRVNENLLVEYLNGLQKKSQSGAADEGKTNPKVIS